jgi:PDZ domain-containing protein
MSRRLRTLVAGGVLLVALLVLMFTLPVPYAILSPGPTYNTLGEDQFGQQIIKIEGTTTHPTTGNLNMTTVSIGTQGVTIFEALRGWLLHDESVVPRSAVIPPGQTQEQVNQQNTQDFAESQDNATAAAFCELGYPRGFGVLNVDPKGPSNGRLNPGDFLVSLDGRPIDSQAKLTAVLATEKPGTTVTVDVTRHRAPASTRVTLGARTDGGKGARLGVTVTTGCLAPFTVDLGLGNQIGGPSAGMMFALGIMDKLGSDNLTNGRFIAGTGTISPEGAVGAIGGIQLKMIAARRAGATIFLAPASNCNDVVGAIPSGLNVIKVSTLHQAVQDLEAVERNRPVPHC